MVMSALMDVRVKAKKYMLLNILKQSKHWLETITVFNLTQLSHKNH